MVGTSILGSGVVGFLCLVAPQKGRRVGDPHLTMGVGSCVVERTAGTR